MLYIHVSFGILICITIAHVTDDQQPCISRALQLFVIAYCCKAGFEMAVQVLVIACNFRELVKWLISGVCLSNNAHRLLQPRRE